MNKYRETVDYLFSRLPMFHRIGEAALKPGLDNITTLCACIGNPQNKFKSIHIAGTNGKGSTAHFISSILQEAGYKVGLFSSPHLLDFRERIKINGEMITENEVITFVSQNKIEFEKIEASFFEYTTAMAFWYFDKMNVDIAVVEVGLGGRLDSTNIITPELSIITSISLDHTNLLGNTIQEISSEKAGIIKPNTPVIVAENSDECISVCLSKALPISAELILAQDYDLPTNVELGLKGEYQIANATTAFAACQVLEELEWRISDKSILDGLKNVISNTHFSGRWQQLNETPRVFCDVAHNADAIHWIVKQLKAQQCETLRIVLGMASDKNHSEVLQQLPKNAFYYFCHADNPRSLKADELMTKAMPYALLGTHYQSVKLAYKQALEDSSANDFIFVGGSVFVVAEIL